MRIWQGGDKLSRQIAFGSTPGLTETSVQNPQRLVLPLADNPPKVLAATTKQSSRKSLSSGRSVKTLKDLSRIPKSGSAHISEEVPPSPVVCHQVDSTTGQEASVSNPEEPSLRLARGSSQVLSRPSWPNRRCQSPTDLSMSSQPATKKLRFSSVESVISVGEEVPMGNFGRTSVPEAINDSEADECCGSLSAIWSWDHIQEPMLRSRRGESALPELPGPDPVPINAGEHPKVVHPRSPWKKGEWMSEVPLSKSCHDSALLKARQRNVLRLKRANKKDWDTLSKYLPSDVSSLFLFGMEGPDDYHSV